MNKPSNDSRTTGSIQLTEAQLERAVGGLLPAVQTPREAAPRVKSYGGPDSKPGLAGEQFSLNYEE